MKNLCLLCLCVLGITSWVHAQEKPTAEDSVQLQKETLSKFVALSTLQEIDEFMQGNVLDLDCLCDYLEKLPQKRGEWLKVLPFVEMALASQLEKLIFDVENTRIAIKRAQQYKDASYIDLGFAAIGAGVSSYFGYKTAKLGWAKASELKYSPVVYMIMGALYTLSAGLNSGEAFRSAKMSLADAESYLTKVVLEKSQVEILSSNIKTLHQAVKSKNCRDVIDGR